VLQELAGAMLRHAAGETRAADVERGAVAAGSTGDGGGVGNGGTRLLRIERFGRGTKTLSTEDDVAASAATLRMTKWAIGTPFVLFVCGCVFLLLFANRASYDSGSSQPAQLRSKGRDSGSQKGDLFASEGVAQISTSTNWAQELTEAFARSSEAAAEFERAMPAVSELPCARMLFVDEELSHDGFANVAIRLTALLGVARSLNMSLFVASSQGHAKWPLDCGSGEGWRCYFERIVPSCRLFTHADVGTQAIDDAARALADTAACEHLNRMPLAEGAGCWRSEPRLPFLSVFYKTHTAAVSRLALMRELAPSVWNRMRAGAHRDVVELLRETELLDISADGAAERARERYVALDVRTGPADGLQRRSALRPYVEAQLAALEVVAPGATTLYVACGRSAMLDAVRAVIDAWAVDPERRQRARVAWRDVRVVSVQDSAVRETRFLGLRDAYSRVHDEFVATAADVVLLRHAELVVTRFSSSFARFVQMLRTQPPHTMVSVDFAWDFLYLTPQRPRAPYCSDEPHANGDYCNSELRPSTEQLRELMFEAERFQLSLT